MQDLHERIEYVRKQLGKTYLGLGEVVGIKEAAMRTAIKKKNIKPYYVNVLCEKLGLSKEWLETGVGYYLDKKNIVENIVDEPIKPKPRNDAAIIHNENDTLRVITSDDGRITLDFNHNHDNPYQFEFINDRDALALIGMLTRAVARNIA